MSSPEALLEIQDLDTTIDQLRHRRAHLPERAELESHEATEAQLRTDRARIVERREVIARDLKRLEDHVTGIEEKVNEVNGHLYGDGLTSPKEAMTLQEELDALGRRQRGLEDEEIVLMELAEPLDAELEAMAATEAELVTTGAGIVARLAEAESSIDAELATAEASRAVLAEGFDAAQLADYDELRRQNGGIAVARLVGGSCQGCHLLLSATAQDRIKRAPEDATVHCDECGRLLVR